MKVRCRRRCSLLAPKENQKGRRCPQGMNAPVGLLSRRPVCEANAACSARQGRSDFDALDPRIKGCSPLIIPKQKSKRKNASRFAQTGCGAQRPLRALSGTRVLLTAAPTAPPCIRRWRRSSPLHFFLASPIDRPLSRCGGSSPQGSGCPSPSPSVTPCPLFVAARHLPPTGGSLSKGEARSVPFTVLALPSGELARSA